jgi:hypothetical protein
MVVFEISDEPHDFFIDLFIAGHAKCPSGNYLHK